VPESKSDLQEIGNYKMRDFGRLALSFPVAAFLCVAQDVVSVVHGTVTKMDHGTKTVVVKTADGTEHTIKVTAKPFTRERKKRSMYSRKEQR